MHTETITSLHLKFADVLCYPMSEDKLGLFIPVGSNTVLETVYKGKHAFVRGDLGTLYAIRVPDEWKSVVHTQPRIQSVASIHIQVICDTEEEKSFATLASIQYKDPTEYSLGEFVYAELIGTYFPAKIYHICAMNKRTRYRVRYQDINTTSYWMYADKLQRPPFQPGTYDEHRMSIFRRMKAMNAK